MNRNHSLKNRTKRLVLTGLIAAGTPWAPAYSQDPSARLAAELPAVITMRTLADIQQMQDHKALQEKIQAILQRKQDPAAQTVAPVAPSAAPPAVRTAPAQPAGTASEGVVPVAQQSPPAQRPKKRPTLRVLSVYGPSARLHADAVDHSGQLHALREQDRLGPWTVTHIRQEGILLHRQTVTPDKPFHDPVHSAAAIFLKVGESMDDGSTP